MLKFSLLESACLLQSKDVFIVWDLREATDIQDCCFFLHKGAV